MYLFFSLFSARLRPQGLFFGFERRRGPSAMAGEGKYARQVERKIFPRPHGQNAGIGRCETGGYLCGKMIPRGRTAENGTAATRWRTEELKKARGNCYKRAMARRACIKDEDRLRDVNRHAGRSLTKIIFQSFYIIIHHSGRLPYSISVIFKQTGR